MGEKRYIISDAAKLIEVESHVLRYWEEELNINVPRNEMGHRYYTDFYIDLFKRIRELKDGGFQLKAIKMLIPELMDMQNSKEMDTEILKDELFGKISEGSAENVRENTELSEIPESSVEEPAPKESKLEQFQSIITEVVSNALKENSGMLGREVGDIVSDNVIKEMDYLMHIREKQEEERFRKLDETIRNYQSSGRERIKAKKGIFAKIKRG